ncbi:MAG: hypothetical protein IPP61_19615 [Cytophagaceae bacterium]|nr:hypothetical protein [Cytophagaceae bacterium]MBL0300406.1 hypothetical protein [Cytophagaceae bacterium]MBL0327335.1 hypothetical protein [Cytophagaceae bacterium]
MGKSDKTIFWIVAIIAIGILWWFQYEISANIPWWDDFHGIMLPVYNLFSDQPLIEKLKLFFSLNNEHRVVNDRLFMLIIYLFRGTFEMKTLALLGFINLIGLLFILIKSTKQQIANYVYFIPVVFLIFQAQYYESLQSLMVPFQNFSVMLYAYLSFYFLIFRKNKSLLWAVIFAILALYSHGNGILAFLIGIIILVFNKRFSDLKTWLPSGMIAIGLYFWGYHKPEWGPKVSFLDHPIAALRYVFEFLGAYFQNITDLSSRVSQSGIKHLLLELYGFILIAVFIFIFSRKYIFPLKLDELRKAKSDQFLIVTIGFIFATGLMIGISRTGFPMLSRYTINSTFLSVSVYLFILNHIKFKKTFTISASILTLFILIISYYNNTDTAKYIRINGETDGINWQKNHSWANQYSDSSHVGRLNPLLDEPFRDKKYIFPKNILDNFDKIEITGIMNNLNYQIVDGTLEISNQDIITENQTAYFSIENDKYKFIFPAKNLKNTIFSFLTSAKYYSGKYRTAFPVKVIPAGEYHIYYMEIIDNKISKKDTKKQLKTPYLIF